MSGWFAVVNPAAGGGRCGKLVEPTLQRLRDAGLSIEAQVTSAPGAGVQLVRDAWARGHRAFLAVGGDGTAHEIVNGLFATPPSEPPTLGFLPLGTGNSFLRDFSKDGLQHAMQALVSQRRRPCDVMCLRHADGTVYYINLLSMGFSAEVGALTNRRFKGFGSLGYLLGIVVCLWRRRLHDLPHRCDDDGDIDRCPALLLTFSNSKYTGGNMLIAPQADVSDGLIEYVRVGPLGRFKLLRSLRRLYDGTYVDMDMTLRRGVRHAEFDLQHPVDVMIDGEILKLQCRSLDVLPAALQVVA